MIAVPGDVKDTTLSGIIADEMAIGMINQKTTAVRIIPVIVFLSIIRSVILLIISVNTSFDKFDKKWVWINNGAAVFGMELYSDEPFVSGYFHNLDQI